MSTLVAVVLFIAITAYCVFGGADFGAGFWDLIAGGADRGDRPREVIDRSIGPVWEANHVWLIFVFVVLWTAFSEAYASIWLTMFVPLTLAALGVVIRGSSFAFRKTVTVLRERREFGAGFGVSSLLVPFFLGCVAGGVASGRVPAVAVVAYLAACYLVHDAQRMGDDEMAAYFHRRAVGSGVAAGIIAFVGIFVLRADAEYLFDGLTSRALPLVILSAIAGTASLVFMLRRPGTSRPLAIVAVASVVLAWGVAQWPYLLPETLEVADAAAPSGTLTALVLATIGAVVLVVPSFILLYTLDQRGLLPAEGVD
jgi:cytochrome d ubiquinol oxidase subunit II